MAQDQTVDGIIDAKMSRLSVPDAMDFVWWAAIVLMEPVFLWGSPGIGKSELMWQLCLRVLDAQIMTQYGVKSNKIVLIDIRLSQYESVDLRGFPGVHKDGTTVWHVPSTLPFTNNPRFDDDVLYVIFFDEANAAHQSVLAVAYQLLNERRVGEHELRGNVVMVCAGNREGDKGITNRMPKPLANRLTHVEVVTSAKACVAHWVTKGVQSICLAFILSHEKLLNTFDPNNTDKAFATPRTWTKAFKYFASAMPKHLMEAAIIGSVGPGPARELWAFAEMYHKMIPIGVILANPTTTAVPTEPSEQYAVALNISGNMNAKTVEALHLYLKRMPVVFFATAWELAVKRDGKLRRSNAFLDYSKSTAQIYEPV